MARSFEPAEGFTLSVAELTFLPDPRVPAGGRMAVYRPPGGDDGDLAAVARAWGLPAGERAQARLAIPDGDVVKVADVGVLAVPLMAALPVLLATDVGAGPAYRRPPDSLRAWATATRLALRMVVGQQGAPRLVLGDDGTVHGVWRAVMAGDEDARAELVALSAAMPPSSHAVALDSSRVWEPHALVGAFLDAVLDLAVRTAAPQPWSERPRARLLPWTARWVEALADAADATVPLREEAADLVAAADGWLATVEDAGVGGTAELELFAPVSQDGEWELVFGLRTESGQRFAAADVWSGAVGPDADANAAQEALLRGLGQCARVFPPVETALREATPRAARLTLADAWRFLTDAAPLLDGAGLVVCLPDDLVAYDLRLRMRVGDAADDAASQIREGAALHELEAEVAWEVALGDATLSPDELQDLLAAHSPLVRWRDRWVRVDPEVVDRLRHLPDPERVDLAEALTVALAGSSPAGADALGGDGMAPPSLAPVAVVADGTVARLVQRLRDAGARPAPPSAPEGFVGELRGYQQRGVVWLDGMGSLGFGAVLADDMGLGKTVQLIAYLLTRGGGPHLIVCPTSVVGNWQRELQRFAPGLTVVRHHGAGRDLDVTSDEVVLTSYGTLRRDIGVMDAVDWDVVTLDEAQHVKNPATAGARAVRRLRARQRIAMTGTPLENRLAELWSIMDATNPGLLGSRAAFTRRYVRPIERRRDAHAAARLRRLVAPFVLRREKGDPDVALDLPDKIERTVVCPLTPEQADLYEQAVARVLGSGDGLRGASSMERRGRILALLTQLKQVCNHPAQAIGEREGTRLTGRSGKLAAAREIIAEAARAGDQVLVFTQYVQMARLLARQLGQDLDAELPVLHGGVPAGARDHMVARFQGETAQPPPPVLIVSLRAGGTGLNLTAATHVLHYDRWWNPAVEDQATDRAHRIGQQRTVEVHKLVTAGTVEERIAEVLEAKRALAETVVGAGESWVTELADAELAELVALSADASVADLDDDESWDRDDDLEEAS